MEKLNAIEEKLVTQQQKNAFVGYKLQVVNWHRNPSEKDFQYFYSGWCFENSRFNDIDQSNFESDEESNED